MKNSFSAERTGSLATRYSEFVNKSEYYEKNIYRGKNLLSPLHAKNFIKSTAWFYKSFESERQRFLMFILLLKAASLITCKHLSDYEIFKILSLFKDVNSKF